MVRLLLFLFLESIVIASNCQNIRCLTAQKYETISGGGNSLPVNNPITVCYTDSYFSFCSPDFSSVTFKITARSVSKNSHGYMEESFFSEEDNLTPRGYYHVQILYELEKTIIIGLTLRDFAYIIKSKSFIGSPETSSNQTIATSIKSLKEKAADTIPNPNKSLKYCPAKTYIDINKYVSDSLESEKYGLNGKWSAEINCSLFINEMGQITSVEFRGSTAPSIVKSNFYQDISNILKSMPPWVPNKNQYGNPMPCNCTLTVSISK